MISRLPLKEGSRFPPNLSHHARHQAKLRGFTIDRLTCQQQDEWKAATGYDDKPPRWLLKDSLGKPRGHFYTLADIIKFMPEIPTNPTTDQE